MFSLGTPASSQSTDMHVVLNDASIWTTDVSVNGFSVSVLALCYTGGLPRVKQ